ncbi:MAG: transglutaminase family protein [Pseudopedobacter saltans]|uniref:Transglutaminase family protein n=1 Tax=Pseudopedobacter saltans TaxID=151895 RepID=A0A2W5HFW1_9SPHI|nr:MAG: transglutaminase family protein [Pseudopedobacter saltans]
MPIYNITHVTQYIYDAPVIDSINQIKIYPFHGGDQNVIHQDVTITSDPSIHFFLDYWGNRVGVFSITEPHTTMTIDSKIIVQTMEKPMQIMKPLSEIIRLDYSKPYIIQSNDIIDDILSMSPKNGDKRELTEWCSQYINANFEYKKGVTTIETTVDEILEKKQGVCQDFAHLLLHMLRTLGITSRYVSGYICPNRNGMRGQGATHAWVEAWLDDYGWYGIDPTNNMWVTDTHVKLAVGRNFNDCSPVKGSFKGIANQSMNVYVSVGFEDGHIIEENNDVEMHQQKVQTPIIVPKQFYMQQQQ